MILLWKFSLATFYSLKLGHVFPHRWMTDGKFIVNLSPDESAESSHSSQTGSNSSASAPLSCVDLSLINCLPCTTATTHHDPGRDTDNSTANIDNWLQQVTEKNGARQERKKRTYRSTRHGHNSRV